LPPPWPGDVVGGAWLGAGAREGQPEGDGSRWLESSSFAGTSLIVIRAITVSNSPAPAREEPVGRERPLTSLLRAAA